MSPARLYYITWGRLVAADFHVHNLGCKVNRAESDMLVSRLLSAGGLPVTQEEASVILVNTCTVTAEADAKTRKAVRRAAAAAKQPWVIATGCAIAVDRASYEALGERVFAEPDRLAALQKAAELLALQLPSETNSFEELRQGEAFATRRGIKIQDGCDNNCSYCIVRIARGAARSVPQKDVIDQILTAERAGIREIILTGVNIGAYSFGRADLLKIIEESISSTEQLRLRLSSLEPQHVSDGLLTFMAQSEGRLCAHLHLPLQSGCDKTLKEMQRLYDTGYFSQLVTDARSLMPHVSLTTDVIVGFPGETEEDFSQSLAFCESMRFAKMHVFRYSQRLGTPSAQRSDQLAPDLIARRAARMREAAVRMQRYDGESRVGSIESVLIERAGRGTSESYHKVKTPAEIEVGSLTPLQIVGHHDNLLLAAQVQSLTAH